MWSLPKFHVKHGETSDYGEHNRKTAIYVPSVFTYCILHSKWIRKLALCTQHSFLEVYYSREKMGKVDPCNALHRRASQLCRPDFPDRAPLVFVVEMGPVAPGEQNSCAISLEQWDPGLRRGWLCPKLLQHGIGRLFCSFVLPFLRDLQRCRRRCFILSNTNWNQHFQLQKCTVTSLSK